MASEARPRIRLKIKLGKFVIGQRDVPAPGSVALRPTFSAEAATRASAQSASSRLPDYPPLGSSPSRIVEALRGANEPIWAAQLLPRWDSSWDAVLLGEARLGHLLPQPLSVKQRAAKRPPSPSSPAAIPSVVLPAVLAHGRQPVDSPRAASASAQSPTHAELSGAVECGRGASPADQQYHDEQGTVLLERPGGAKRGAPESAADADGIVRDSKAGSSSNSPSVCTQAAFERVLPDGPGGTGRDTCSASPSRPSHEAIDAVGAAGSRKRPHGERTGSPTASRPAVPPLLLPTDKAQLSSGGKELADAAGLALPQSSSGEAATTIVFRHASPECAGSDTPMGGVGPVPPSHQQRQKRRQVEDGEASPTRRPQALQASRQRTPELWSVEQGHLTRQQAAGQGRQEAQAEPSNQRQQESQARASAVVSQTADQMHVPAVASSDVRHPLSVAPSDREADKASVPSSKSASDFNMQAGHAPPVLPVSFLDGLAAANQTKGAAGGVFPAPALEMLQVRRQPAALPPTAANIQALISRATEVKREGDRQSRRDGQWTLPALARYAEAGVRYMEACEMMLAAGTKTVESTSRAVTLYGQTAELLWIAADTTSRTRCSEHARETLRILCERLCAACCLRQAAAVGAARHAESAEQLAGLAARQALLPLRGPSGVVMDGKGSHTHSPNDSMNSAQDAGRTAGGPGGPELHPPPALLVPPQLAPRLLAAARQMSRFAECTRRSVNALQAFVERPDVRGSAAARQACMHIAAVGTDSGMGDVHRLVVHAQQALHHIRLLG